MRNGLVTLNNSCSVKIILVATQQWLAVSHHILIHTLMLDEQTPGMLFEMS